MGCNDANSIDHGVPQHHHERDNTRQRLNLQRYRQHPYSPTDTHGGDVK